MPQFLCMRTSASSNRNTTNRPDYPDVVRFICETSSEEDRPQLNGLTTTAKLDVDREITEYFLDELNSDLKIVDEGARRTNLGFVFVHSTGAQGTDGDGAARPIAHTRTQRRSSLARRSATPIPG